MAMKISLRRRSRYGHSSTMAVMKPSIVQNCESRPMRSSMKKKRQAQMGEPGSFSTADGYAKKAKPGPGGGLESVRNYFPSTAWNLPEAATSLTGLCCSWAIKPTTEKMTKPANMLVDELTVQTIKASLEVKYFSLVTVILNVILTCRRC